MQATSKQASRTRCVSARSQLSGPDRARAAAELAGAVVGALADLPPGPVAAYASVGTEPDTAALLTALAGGPRAVLLPLLLLDGDLDWAAYDGRLEPGPRGLLQPPGPALGIAAVADCALLVVPALAVDRSGTRLGRGGGSYDRALARVRPGALVVALLHDGELLPPGRVVPTEPHDVTVSAAASPIGLTRLGR